MKLSRKHNPISDEARAIRGYEHFHGLQPSQMTLDSMDWPPPQELEDEFGPLPDPPEEVALLGEAIALLYEDKDTLYDQEIEFGKPLPFLATDWGPEGSEELYLTGGRYSVRKKSGCLLGPLIWVEYRTIKSFDDSTPTVYKHWFAEPWPSLGHNSRGDQLYILRGESEFWIDRSRPVSAGIDG